MQMTEFLGSHVSKILESEPFKNWPVERSVDDDLDERIIHYVFNEHGLELRCDADENVSTIFLHSEEYNGFDESISRIPFSLRREEVLERFGTPSKRGDKTSDPILGVCGAWDRFPRPNSAIHVEYRPDADEIKKITLIRGDVVP